MDDSDSREPSEPTEDLLLGSSSPCKAQQKRVKKLSCKSYRSEVRKSSGIVQNCFAQLTMLLIIHDEFSIEYTISPRKRRRGLVLAGCSRGVLQRARDGLWFIGSVSSLQMKKACSPEVGDSSRGHSFRGELPSGDSCFRPLAGMKLVFDPSAFGHGSRKNPCPDCYRCQFCSDDRCNACRGKKGGSKETPPRKLSLKEQIALYERVNSQAGSH